MNEKLAKAYFGILGIITLIFGAIDLIVTFGGGNFSFGILQIPSDGVRGGWGGLVVLFAGFFTFPVLKSFPEYINFLR